MELFLPAKDEDILVPGEAVHYRESKHYIALAEPATETVAILFLVMTVAVGVPPFGRMLVGLLVLLALLSIHRLVSRNDITQKDIAVALVVLFVLTSAQLNLTSLALLVAMFAIGRFTLIFIRWAFYETRFITDRRVMETSGFLQRRVSTMPLSKLTDLTLHRSSLAELLDYGRLHVESAGQNQALSNINYIIRPLEFHELVVHLATKQFARD